MRSGVKHVTLPLQGRQNDIATYISPAYIIPKGILLTGYVHVWPDALHPAEATRQLTY